MQAKLFPGRTGDRLGPTSPPDWSRLGWKVGWILEEGYSGPQFWATDPEDWKSLTANFGRVRDQKNSQFARWYGKLLNRLGQEQGLPLTIDSIRWRRMDFAEFPGKPRINGARWWHLELAPPDCGGWHWVFPGSFYSVFEEPDPRSERSLPWNFSELWKTLPDRERTVLIRRLSRDRGLLGHVANLILAGALERSDVLDSAPRDPRRELRNLLVERSGTLDNRSPEARRDVLRRWKGEAEDLLANRVGSWLEEDAFSRGDWKKPRQQWEEYRREQLKQTLGSRSWTRFLDQLSPKDLRQVLPRLDFSTLLVSLTKIPASTRDHVAQGLSRRNREKLAEQFRQNRDSLEVYRARQAIFEQGKEVIDRLNYHPEGDWELPDPS